MVRLSMLVCLGAVAVVLGRGADAAPVVAPEGRLAAQAGEGDGVRPAGSPLPANPEALAAWREGRGRLLGGDLAKAEDSFKRAAGLDPKSHLPVLGLAEVALHRGDLGRAEAAMAQARERAPKSAEVAAVSGRVAVARKRAADAEREFRRAMALDPKFMTPRLDLADLFMATGRVDDAVEAFRAATTADPKHAGAAFGLGRALAARGDLPGAQRAFEQSARLAPALPMPPVALAEVLGAQKRFDDAHAQLDKALQLAPEHMPALAARVNLLRAAGKRTEAVAEQQRIVARLQGPAVAPAYVQLGTLQQEAGQAAEAEAAYRKAIEADPKFHLAWNNAAWLAAERRRDLDRALSDARRAIELAPGNANYHDTLGQVLQARGELQQATAAFSQAAKLAPGSAQAQFRLAQSLDKQRLDAQALAAYRAALAIQRPFEGSEEARRRVAELSGAARR